MEKVWEKVMNQLKQNNKIYIYQLTFHFALNMLKYAHDPVRNIKRDSRDNI